jgi:F420-dependent oxidoreductase-like protein
MSILDSGFSCTRSTIGPFPLFCLWASGPERGPAAPSTPVYGTSITPNEEVCSHFSIVTVEGSGGMRIGLMIGPERGRYATKIARLEADARWAEEAGLATVWIPQIPDEFDALTAATLIGAATERIEVGTAVVPVQPRHPIALAQQALSVQAVCEGRLTLGLGVSHHWVIDEMLGLPYEHPVATMRSYVDVLDQALGGPGPVDVDNELFRVHNPLDITDLAPTPVLLAALGPLMLRLCGERTDGTILWMADERAIGSHIVPILAAAAEAAGRPAPRVVAGVPICLCAEHEVETAVARTNRILSEAEVSPNYQRLLDHGDANTVGDILVAGREASIVKRLQAFADAGVTDLSVRVVPIGDNRDELIASSKRTRALLSSLTASF